MNCSNCQNETTNTKFCSRSCAATYNNKLFPKRKKKKPALCKICHLPIKGNRSQTHQECLNEQFYQKSLTKKLCEYTNKRNYQIHSQIRYMARKLYLKQITQPKCENCQYDKHIEICHIKPINSFKKTARLGEINHLNNLIALCPNCHWEFDAGLLKISKSPPSTNL